VKLSPINTDPYVFAIEGVVMNGQKNQTKHDEVFVSYAWKAENEKAVVDRLEQACHQRDIILLRDNNEIKYKDSILEYMKKLGAGNYIIVVLSDAYLKSRFCMFELLTIHEHKQFHQRVFPIALQGLDINEPETKLDYLDYWDGKIESLEERMQKSRQAHRNGVNEDLNLYMEIRRSCDNLMTILADMNVLTEEIHVETDFEVLIDKILLTLNEDDKKQKEAARKKFRLKVKEKINQQLNRNPLFLLKTALVEELASQYPADTLCANDIETSIKSLHKATKKCFDFLLDENPSDTERQIIWNGAVSIFGWLILLSVQDEKVIAYEKLFNDESNNFNIKIPVETEAGIEVFVSRLSEQPATFKVDDACMDVAGRYCVGAHLPEGGCHEDDLVLEIKRLIWKSVFNQEPPAVFSKSDIDDLNYTLQVRREYGENHYLIIPVSVQNNPLNNPEVYRKLSEDLSALWTISIGRGENESEVLLMPEFHLLVLIREFLRINHKGNKK